MAPPQSISEKPAIACVKRSIFPSGTRETPVSRIPTAARTVTIVVIEKVAVTSRTPETFAAAHAASMSGISDSQGPKIKSVKRIQGVICFPLEVCACMCA